MGKQVWLNQWTDLSEKFGLGFTMSNSLIGVVFNDKKILLFDPKNLVYKFHDRASKTDALYKTVDEVPSSLLRRVEMLRQF